MAKFSHHHLALATLQYLVVRGCVDGSLVGAARLGKLVQTLRAQHLGLSHTRYFYSQHCDKSIDRQALENITYFTLSFVQSSHRLVNRIMLLKIVKYCNVFLLNYFNILCKNI